jgi:hypothetical protein
MRLPKDGSICGLKHYSTLSDLGRFFSFVILYTVGRTPWTGDRPVARPLPRQTINTHNSDINALNGIRTHDCSARASEGSSCLSTRCHRDRRTETCSNRQIKPIWAVRLVYFLFIIVLTAKYHQFIIFECCVSTSSSTLRMSLSAVGWLIEFIKCNHCLISLCVREVPSVKHAI